MKKVIKYFIIAITILPILFYAYDYFAEEKMVVKDCSFSEYSSMVLYENGDLYFWDDTYNYIVQNVEQILDVGGHGYYYLTKDNELFWGYGSRRLITESVVYFDEYSLIKESGDLYKIEGSYYEYGKIEKIFTNVKDYKYKSYGASFLIRDTNNNLYAYGDNIFGRKINDGMHIYEEPILLSTNVIEYGMNYFINDQKELYYIDSMLPFPMKIVSDCDSFVFENDNSSFWEASRTLFYLDSGKTKMINFEIINANVVKMNQKTVLETAVKNMIQNYDSNRDARVFLALDIQNNLLQIKIYRDKTINIELFDKNIEKMNGREYIKDEDLFFIDYDSTIIKKMTAIYLNIGDYYVTKNGNILLSGYGYRYLDYNSRYSTKLSGGEYYQIKNIPNSGANVDIKNLMIYDVNLKEFTVGDKYYLSVLKIPCNTTVENNILFESSNTSIATVNNLGEVNFLNPGTVTIKVKTENGNIYDEVEFKVYNKLNGLKFSINQNYYKNYARNILIEEKEITFNMVESKYIIFNDVDAVKLYIEPDNSGSIISSDLYYVSREYDQHGSIYIGDTIDNENSFFYLYPHEGTNTYDIRNSEGIIDTIKININVDHDPTEIGYSSSGHYLGNTLYIYMKESNQLQLETKVYPENAIDKTITYTSSDETTATVDENGLVTALRSGKVTITMKTINNVETKADILIFDSNVSTIIGDIDGDGVVDILDLVKLRKGLAGAE